MNIHKPHTDTVLLKPWWRVTFTANSLRIQCLWQFYNFTISLILFIKKGHECSSPHICTGSEHLQIAACVTVTCRMSNARLCFCLVGHNIFLKEAGLVYVGSHRKLKAQILRDSGPAPDVDTAASRMLAPTALRKAWEQPSSDPGTMEQGKWILLFLIYLIRKTRLLFWMVCSPIISDTTNETEMARHF